MKYPIIVFDLVRGLRGASAVCLALVAGCVPPPYETKAAHSLSCSKERVTSEALSDGIWLASGCGKKDVVHSMDNVWVSVREEAAVQLSCNVADIRVELTGDGPSRGRQHAVQFVVTGCGKESKYLVFQGMLMQAKSKDNAKVTPTAVPSAQSASPERAPATAQDGESEGKGVSPANASMVCNPRHPKDLCVPAPYTNEELAAIMDQSPAAIPGTLTAQGRTRLANDCPELCSKYNATYAEKHTTTFTVSTTSIACLCHVK